MAGGKISDFITATSVTQDDYLAMSENSTTNTRKVKISTVVPLINDLTTGGVTNYLSAEQGKVLDGKITINTNDITALKDEVNKTSLTNIEIGTSPVTTLTGMLDGFVDGLVFKGKTMYKTSGGTYTDTYVSGVSIESTGEVEGKMIMSSLKPDNTVGDTLNTTVSKPLRSQGTVKDIYNVVNKTITRYIGQMTFKGVNTENWVLGNPPLQTNTLQFKIQIVDGKTGLSPTDINLMCDKFVSDTSANNISNDSEGIAFDDNGYVLVRILKSKLATQDISGFKLWLASVNTTIVYQLLNSVTETVKKVSTLQTFKDGYLQLQNAIIPTVNFNYSVELASVVSEHTKVIDELEDIVVDNSNKIGDLSGNGLTETDLATAIKNNRMQLSENKNDVISLLVKKLENGEIAKIKLIGDSITEGYGATGHINTTVNVNNGNVMIFNDGTNKWYESEHSSRCWANLFRDTIAIKYPMVSFINAGIGGKTTTWALANKQYWIGNDEDVVFVMLGSNDRFSATSLSSYKSELTQFLAYVQSNCKLMIVLTANPADDDYTSSGNISPWTFTTEDIDRTITSICLANKYPHISFYREMMEYSKITGYNIAQFIDGGAHPNDSGHDIMWSILQKKLGISNIYVKEKNNTHISQGVDKQFIIDGNFQIAQANPSVATEITNPSFYTYPVFDMWRLTGFVGSGDTLPTTIKHSQRRIVESGASINAVPNSKYCYRININGAGAVANSSYNISQPIENGVSKYCVNNSEVILSFWARSNIPNKKLYTNLTLNYGTGGSPTPSDYVGSTNSLVTLSNSWCRFTLTFKMPSFTSKVFGNNNDDYLDVAIGLISSSQGFVGAGDIEIAQVSMGTPLTSFVAKSFDEELRSCMRYYEKSYAYVNPLGKNSSWEDAESINSAVSTYLLSNGLIKYLVPKRIVPTVKIYSFDGVANTIYNASTSSNLATSDIAITGRRRGFEISSPTNVLQIGHQYMFQWIADCRI